MNMRKLMAVTAVGMMAALPSYADAAALSVSLSGDTFTVAVPANSYDDTSKLYIVWGAADHGAEISAWPLANRRAYSGAISATAATYQFSADGIPAGSVVRAIVASDVRLIDSWVSLGNGQYVNTGIKGNEAYGTEFKYRRTGSTGAWASVMGRQHARQLHNRTEQRFDDQLLSSLPGRQRRPRRVFVGRHLGSPHHSREALDQRRQGPCERSVRGRHKGDADISGQQKQNGHGTVRKPRHRCRRHFRRLVQQRFGGIVRALLLRRVALREDIRLERL